MRTRPVLGIDANAKLNRALWMLAESMRELKGGGSDRGIGSALSA
jgi:hypothetical protein